MDAYIGEIRAVAFNYAPVGWALCQGQILLVSQYPTLFSILTNAFGGDGRTTFAVPNLSGSIATHQGQGPGTQNRPYADGYGSEQIVLDPSQMPLHNHTANAALCSPVSENPNPGADDYLGHSTITHANTYAPGNSSPSSFFPYALGPQGGGQAHENRQPYLVLNYIICVNDGEYPVRNN
jgi:microcystin-dependent protein